MDIKFNPKAAVRQSHQQLLDDCKEFLARDAVVTKSCPEYVFVNTYLPMFFAGGKVTEADGTVVELPVTAWLERYAGTAYNEVNVVDAHGNILFIVPPLTASAGTYQSKVHAPGQEDINNIFTDASLLMHREVDIHGQKLTAIGGKFLSDLDKTTTTTRNEYRQRWLDIYARYGLIPPPTEEIKEDDDEDSFSGAGELL